MSGSANGRRWPDNAGIIAERGNTNIDDISLNTNLPLHNMSFAEDSGIDGFSGKSPGQNIGETDRQEAEGIMGPPQQRAAVDFASTPTGLLSPRFFRKSLAHVHAQPHARTCSPHDFPSLDGKWASWRFRHAGVSCMSEAAFSCMCPLASAAHHVASR